jgi:hypothetical protein
MTVSNQAEAANAYQNERDNAVLREAGDSGRIQVQAGT